MTYRMLSQEVDEGDHHAEPTAAGKMTESLSYSGDEDEDEDDDDGQSSSFLSTKSRGDHQSARNAFMHRTRSERISDKLHALGWVVVATITAHYTHLFSILYSDTTRIIRPLLHLSMVLFGINALLTIYLILYLPYKFPTSKLHKVHAATPAFWEAYCPNVIPTMTLFGSVGILLLCRAVYPVYGMASPLVLGVIGLGMFFGLHFVPVCW